MVTYILVFFMQTHMKKFVNLIVNKLKDAKLFASQGGPIILSQVHQSNTCSPIVFS